MATKRKPEEEMTVKELTDMDIDRVDAVTQPATRMKFLLIKSEDGKEGPSLDQLLKAAADEGRSEREKLREEAEARAKKYGISFKEGKGHLTPPRGKPTDPEQYADPVNYAYPITDEYVQAAVNYFNHEGQREAGGYTTEEWAIIGKRIAEAANRHLGEGYKYEDGKIVTPSNQKGETKKGVEQVAEGAKQEGVTKEEGAPELNGIPGSPEWEKQDAQMLNQAVQGLLAVKQILVQSLKREQVEQTVGEGEWAEISRLYDALDDLSDLIGDVAAAAALESHEAGSGGESGEGDAENSVAKAGRKMSKDSMAKVHMAMTHIANAAGFKTIKDFHEAAKAMGITEEDDGDEGGGEGTEKTDGKEKGDGGTNTEKNKSETKKSAAGETLAADAVVKALEATGLTTLAKSAEDLLKAVDVIKSLEERVKRIEDQPIPGGPMLRGAATASDYYLVRKGETPDPMAPGALEQAINYVSDPHLRDALSREIARALHPAHQKKE